MAGAGFNPLLRGDNDGVVSVHETTLPDETERGRVLIPALHNFLSGHPVCVAAAVGYLESGRIPETDDTGREASPARGPSWLRLHG